MIYSIEIENFYCIRDRQILNLTVPRTTPDWPERFAPIFEGSELRAPKVVAVFGANGSGKSTVLKALSFLVWFAADSFQHPAPALPCERFNDEESANRPVRLAIEFGGPAELTNRDAERISQGQKVPQGVYRYELELGAKDGAVTSVNLESLKQKPGGKGKWLRVFERKADRKLLGSRTFSLSGFSKVIDKIRKDVSVVSTLALFDHEPSQVLIAQARNVFSNILVDKTEPSDTDVVNLLANNPNIVEALNKELQRIDVGIQSMEILQTPSGPAPYFKHEGLHADMPWYLESHGTRSFIRMFPLLLTSLSQGGTAIIDEIDNAVHPLILQEILRWYYDPGRNAHGGQLWMTCQSVSLLDELSKEEIVLCEKDRHGRTEIYSLMDMKAVRRSDNLYKKYMGGVYGAVPRVG